MVLVQSPQLFRVLLDAFRASDRAVLFSGSEDVVVTSGGIVGTVTAIDKDTLVLRVKPDNLKLQFARSSVSSLLPTEGGK